MALAADRLLQLLSLIVPPQVVPIAIKAAFLNCGQNCASGERFIVQRKVCDKFTQQVRLCRCVTVCLPWAKGGEVFLAWFVFPAPEMSHTVVERVQVIMLCVQFHTAMRL